MIKKVLCEHWNVPGKAQVSLDILPPGWPSDRGESVHSRRWGLCVWRKKTCSLSAALLDRRFEKHVTARKQQVNSPEDHSQSVQPHSGISWFTICRFFSQKLEEETEFSLFKAHSLYQHSETQTDLFQSQDLNCTEVTETLCDLLQRKTSQDQSCTCTGEDTQTGNYTWTFWQAICPLIIRYTHTQPVTAPISWCWWEDCQERDSREKDGWDTQERQLRKRERDKILH